MKGLVLEIQRMSTEDGPGIRTTVFLKGCTLACAWCHNPESISPRPQLQWVGSRCIGCLACVSACPKKALQKGPEGIAINRDICDGCGICAEECPSTAMELLGTAWEADALADEVEKDRSYFESSGGGVTASGGEPAMQPDFTAAFLKRLKEKGISTALDTCGQAGREAYEKILPHADHILFDLKEMDPALHRKFTGHENGRILENIRFAAGYAKRKGAPLWVRTPVIPGFTANETTIRAIGRFIAENLDGAVTRWDLCAFNNLCRDKYARLGKDWVLAGSGLLEKSVMERLADVAGKSGVDPNIVRWSGSTKLED